MALKLETPDRSNSKPALRLPSKLTVDQQMMLVHMLEHAEERAEGWTKHLIEDWFPVTRLTERTVLGSFVWTQSSSKVKWMLKRHAVDIGAGFCTPGDIARDYLAVKFGKRRPRISTPQYEDCVKIKRSAPLAALPGEYDGIYMDLKSAYWSILKVTGWDVEYRPGRYLGVGQDVRDFPAGHIKLARNCLVSCGLPSQLRIWTGSDLAWVKTPNRFINLMLWALVQDVLNGIAYDMVHFAGAVYVHTDGYIIPADREADAHNVAEAWGLPLGEKARGPTIVRGVGEYHIGDIHSRRTPVQRPRVFWSINPHGRVWLRGKMRKLSARRK